MIFIIEGPAKSGKTTLANALRNSQISQKKGCLLVDEDQDGDLDILLEKIIVGEKLGDKPDVAKIPWKPESMIVFVNAKQSLLKDIETRVPGIIELLGPVKKVTVS